MSDSRYIVYGADKETGEDTNRVYVAPSAKDAEYFANQDGIMVSKVEYIESGGAASPSDSVSNHNISLKSNQEVHGVGREMYRDAKGGVKSALSWLIVFLLAGLVLAFIAAIKDGGLPSAFEVGFFLFLAVVVLAIFLRLKRKTQI